MVHKKPSKSFEFPKMKKALVIILVSVLALVLIISYLGFRVKFLIQDELQIYIQPIYSNQTIRNNEKLSLEFTLINNNFRTCRTTCNLSLTDIYTGEKIDDKTWVLDSNQKIDEKYEFLPSLEGEGQRIFLFEAECRNIRSSLCNTDGKSRYRSAMVTLDHTYSEEEEAFLLYLEDTVPTKYQELVTAKNQEKELQSYIEQINQTILTNMSVTEKADYFLIDLNEVISTYYSQQFTEAIAMLDKIPELNHGKEIAELNNKVEKYNSKVEMISDLNEDKFDIAYDYFMKTNDKRALLLKSAFDNIRFHKLATFEDILEYDKLTLFYNIAQETIANYSEEKNQTDKGYYKLVLQEFNLLNTTEINLTGDICYDAVFLYDVLKENESLNDTKNLTFDISYCIEKYDLKPLTEYSKIKLNYESAYSVSFKLSEPPRKCCVFNQCSQCQINSSSYPIIFVHGYSFNNQDPPESSVNAFTKIQRKLNYEGLYINAGDIDYASSSEHYWSEMNSPVSVRATYYYIPYYDTGSIVKSIRKEEGIESYSIRLKELIDYTLSKTGADKVKIVAHSMGGLVTRNYLALFGEDKVDKVILIGTPNHGITGRVETFCAYLGDKRACEDMTMDSVFMKRLSVYNPRISVYNLIGTGCDTDGEDGDGIATAKSSFLEYAENIYINGSCSDFLNTDLHNNIIDPNYYPESYKFIKNVMMN